MVRRIFGFVITLLGIVFAASIVASVVLFLLLGGEPAIPDDATLVLRIGGDLSETAPDDVVSYVSGSRTPTLRATVEVLRKAKNDPRIKAVLLKPTGFATPYWGKVQELRGAVVDFRESGKPVYAYLEYGGDQDYYLASAADKVFLMPSSPLQLVGVATYELFLRGTLDWVGAYPDLHHIGAYKSAPNQFTEKTLTATHREMSTSLNHALYETIVTTVAEARNKSAADVRTLIDLGPFLPEAALGAGLVDGVAYEDQVTDELRKASGGDDSPSPRAVVSGEQYGQVSLASLGLNRGPRIALVYAAGAIVNGKSGFDPVNGAVVGSDTLIEHIRAARRDSSVRAIVLRIDSPGGSASASDAVWRELMREKAGLNPRPIVASMSDLAASGGYYIAMPADVIVAQPSTLTGSIGIFGGKFVTGGVYGKLGANIETTSIGRHAEMDSPARPVQPGRGRQAPGAAAGLLQRLRREGRGFAPQHAGEDRSAGAGARVDRQPGQGERPGRRDRRPGAGDCHRQGARQDCRGERRRNRGVPGAPQLLRAAVGAAVAPEREPRRVGLVVGESFDGRTGRAARASRPVLDVQARRSARDDALQAPAMN